MRNLWENFVEIHVKNTHVISQLGEQRFLLALIFCHFGRKPVKNVGKTFDNDLRKTSVEIIFSKSWENVAETVVENFTTRYTVWDTTFSKRMQILSWEKYIWGTTCFTIV